jgi:hypothetical protein
MELIIYGTKNGYQQHLFASDKSLTTIAQEIRPDWKIDYKALGQTAYSISYASNGSVASVCIIIRDVQRGREIGNIVFSVFVKNSEKLTGSDMMTLLNELIQLFRQKYLTDNNLDKGVIDWVPFKTIFDNYQSNKQAEEDIEYGFLEGKDEAAYFYYSSDSELQSIFDDPYHNEFCPYKRVYFISRELENSPQNPLNALRHNPQNNITGKVDFEKYRLIFEAHATDGLNIEVTADGKKINSKRKIKRHTLLIIKYSQKYRHSLEPVSGTSESLNGRCLKIDSQTKTITISPKQLVKQTKKIEIVVRNHGLKTNISCRKNDSNSFKNKQDNSFIFSGDELGEKWDITVSANEYETVLLQIIPETALNELSLYLRKEKKIKVWISDADTEMKLPVNYRIEAYQNNGEIVKYFENSPDTISFYDSEIDYEWYLLVIAEGFKSNTTQSFIPAKYEMSVFRIGLEKTKIYGYSNSNNCSEGTRRYYLKINPFKGYRTYNNDTINKYDIQEPCYGVDAKFPYQFVTWENHSTEQIDGYDGFYKAVFKLKFQLKHLIYTLSAIGLGLIIWQAVVLLGHSNTNFLSDLELQKYMEYTQQNELNIERLKSYLNTVRLEKENVSSTSWFDNIPFWNSDEKIAEKKRLVKRYNNTISKIDTAIMIRDAINNKKLMALKQFRYSPEQSSFKNAIDSLTSEDVLRALIRIEGMSLSEIADSINAKLYIKQINKQ